MTETGDYMLRGKRVPFLSDQDIYMVAQGVAKFFGCKAKTLQAMGFFIEDIQHKMPIVIDVRNDNDPIFLVARALCDPREAKITLPETLYLRITDGDTEAAFVLCHELGHFFLGHDPVLHMEPDVPPCKNENSEYQADLFAEWMMQRIAGKDWRKAAVQLNLF
ncbi:MAG: ImmA/IrrE family metallo-endopeptidase [Zoogloeaceae bacterium]|jgi:hypothetical protein|nr:ImmA/IrrE family metallo-endopeptidase [Zoogloeaceae bacterium]